MSGLTPRQIFGVFGPGAGGHEPSCARVRAAGDKAAAPAAFIISLREKPDFMELPSRCFHCDFCEVGMIHGFKHPINAQSHPRRKSTTKKRRTRSFSIFSSSPSFLRG